MLRNYFKIAWRNIIRMKGYSAVNIAGLAIALTGFIMILLYLNHELSYDTWDSSLNRVFKVSVRSDEDIFQETPAPLAAFLKEHASEVEAATAIQPSGDYPVLLDAGNKKLYQSGGVAADSAFLTVFPYRIIEGDAATALQKPNAIIISSGLSKKLFGDTDPIGQRIKIFDAFENEVTAVMAEPDKPSQLDVQFIWRTQTRPKEMHWGNYSFDTYVKTRQKISVDKLEGDLNQIYFNARLKGTYSSVAAFRKAGHQAGLFLDPFQDLHNFPRYGASDFGRVAVLFLLAGLLLLSGCINFSNLSVAASIRRAKEVGVRKVLGSGRGQLFWQFMTETAILCFISLCVALLMVQLLLPYFNRPFHMNLDFFHAGNLGSMTLQIAICLAGVIFISGLYPGLILARYNTASVLKGDYSRGQKGKVFRNAFIIVQFCVSAFFMIGVLVINRQMHYMRTKDKGFSGARVMRLTATQKTRDQDFERAKHALLSVPGVQYVSKTTTVPGDATLGAIDTVTYSFKLGAGQYRMASVKVDEDYFKMLGVRLLSGRLFNNGYADRNTRSAVVNESAAKKMGIQNPVGTFIHFPYCDSIPVQIVGVVENFNVAGFEHAVQPTVYTIGNEACMYQGGGAVLVKLSSDDVAQSVTAIQNVWKTIEPDFPLQYSFLDRNFQKLFGSYLQLQKIIGFFGLAAVFIALTGLFALMAFLLGRRDREIGIRKVLGAGVFDIGLLLSKDFVKLVIVSVVIMVPLGWVAADQWLQRFAYHMAMSKWLFVEASAIVIVTALIPIGIQVARAVMMNPVNSLRSE